MFFLILHRFFLEELPFVFESVEVEWSKCDLLCANCHSEEHNPDKFMNLVGAAGFEPATVQDGFDRL